MRVLKHAKIEKEIEFNESTNYYLCIENPRFYREFISDVDTKSDDSDKKVFLEENNKRLKIEKNLFLIHDPLSTELDEKKLNASIQKDLATSVDSQENEKYLSLINEINDYIDSISYDYPLHLSYDSERGLSAFLKAFSIHYESNTNDILISRLENIKILSSVFNYKTIIIRNLADYLTQEELNMFFKECRKLETDILVLSSHLPNYDFDNKFIIRIDSELCEIHIDSSSKKE